MDSIKDGISVVICCYNSQSIIAGTLDNLHNQIFEDDLFREIILVNNASTDHTVEVARKHWENYNSQVTLRIIDQPEPGLSAARRKGLEHSCCDLVVLCDDDNHLFPDYLAKAYKVMQGNPEIGILGGQGFVVSDAPIPDWFDDYKSYYAVGQQAMKSGDITQRNYIWGAGMVLRKKLYLELIDSGYRTKLTDRKGNELSSGGDSEICSLYVLCGYKLWYSSELKFNHFIVQSKLTVKYRDSLVRSLKKSTVILHQLFRLNEFYRYHGHYSNRIFGLLRLTFSWLMRKLTRNLTKHQKQFYTSQFQLLLGPLVKIHPFFYQLQLIKKNHSLRI